jgi:hypothetical protein
MWMSIGTDDDALMEAARELAICPPSRISWTRTQGGAPLPACGGPGNQWREGGVNVDECAM